MVSLKTKILTEWKFWFASFTRKFLNQSSKRQNQSVNCDFQIAISNSVVWYQIQPVIINLLVRKYFNSLLLILAISYLVCLPWCYWGYEIWKIFVLQGGLDWLVDLRLGVKSWISPWTFSILLFYGSKWKEVVSILKPQ